MLLISSFSAVTGTDTRPARQKREDKVGRRILKAQLGLLKERLEVGGRGEDHGVARTRYTQLARR